MKYMHPHTCKFKRKFVFNRIQNELKTLRFIMPENLKSKANLVDNVIKYSEKCPCIISHMHDKNKQPLLYIFFSFFSDCKGF